MTIIAVICAGFGATMAADQALPPVEMTKEISLFVESGWTLTIRSDGSAVLAYGSNALGKANCPERTFALSEIYGDLVPKLREASEKGDVAVAIQASGATTTTARYVDRAEVKPIFTKAQQQLKAFDKSGFNALLKDYPIERKLP